MVSQLELEQYVDPSRSSNVNVEKICQVAKIKLKHAELANGLIRFVFFSAVYMTVVYYQRNSEMASDIDGMLRKIVLETQYRDPWSFEQKTFQDISTVDEFWDWHLYALLPKILKDDYYNGDPVPTSDYGTIHMYSRIINEIRLIQRRAKNGTCDALPYLSNFSSECYGSTYFDGTWGNVDTELFIGRDQKSIYVYESFPSGSPGIPSTNGYFQYLPKNYTEAVAKLRELRSNEWINEGTQFYSLDFTVYNSNSRLFATVLLKVWISNTGNFKMAYQCSTVPSALYEAWQDYIRMAGEILVVIFWFFFVKREIERVGELAEGYGYLSAYLFHNSINAIKVLQVLDFFACFVLWIVIITDPVRNNLVINTNDVRPLNGKFVDFSSLHLKLKLYFICTSVQFAFFMFRLLYYFNMNYTLSKLTATFTKMKNGFILFSIVLLLLYIGFLLMGMLIFGDKFEGFSSFSLGLITVFEYMTGSTNYEELAQVSDAGAPIFFYPFVFIMVIVILNITIAIIMDGYAAMCESRKEMEKSVFKDLVGYSVFEQMYWGFLRRIFYIRSILPQDFQKRLNRVSKLRILQIFRSLEDRTCIDFYELEALVAMNHNVSSMTLIEVINEYDAWIPKNQPDKRGGALEAAQEDKMDAVPQALQSLREMLREIANANQDLQGRVEALLRRVPADPYY
uniref:Polycystin cation channel PKD1/PKD2 domain-containing protein n=1 Tax=Hanusia phi TaxID=3032 RepID=A0A7S0E768_9CRYP|mmetsp:Transcript_17638/g.39876  ORF Transcript_17638/g.39876 Transcript_17638/m.39876 type:complete len:681 (+) Transcript_17638:92-2134(+)